jgi:hypothetical protein
MGTIVLYSSQLLVQENSGGDECDWQKVLGSMKSQWNYEIAMANKEATIAEGREPTQVPRKTSFLESSRARRAKRGLDS